MQKGMTMSICLMSLMISALVICQRLPVGAAERKVPPYILDVKRQCMIDIRTDAAQKTAGEKLAVYQVGLIDATSLSLSFVLCEPFEKADVDLLATGNTQRRQTIETLCEYVTSRNLKPSTVVTLDKDGEIQLEVPQGAYLICQAEKGEIEIQPTLLSVPYVSESLDGWIYDMEVELKATVEAVPTGDSQNLMGYAGLVIAAVLLLLLLLFARKRREKN